MYRTLDAQAALERPGASPWRKVTASICDTKLMGAIVATKKNECQIKPSKPTGRVCDICGRPVPKKTGSGRGGRPRERHNECTIVMARIHELQDLVPKIRFLPPATTPGSNALRGHAKELRAELLGLSRLLTTKSTKCSTEGRDFVPKKVRKRAQA